jgi:hypothetical protein
MSDRVCTSSHDNLSRYHRRSGREYACDDDDDHCGGREAGYMNRRNTEAVADECGRIRSQSGVNVACRVQKATLETREDSLLLGCMVDRRLSFRHWQGH